MQDGSRAARRVDDADRAALMPVSSMTAARYACKMSGWSLASYKLQKILYLAHMVFVGRTEGRLLIDEPFEAWDFGPTLPSLYQRVAIFGVKPIPDVFYDAGYIEGTEEAALLAEKCRHLVPKPEGIVGIMARWRGGAWAKNHKRRVQGIVIPTEDILEDYRKRKALSVKQ